MGHATIWHVRLEDQREAALKLYHRGDMGNEKAGFAYLRSLRGRNVAQVYATTQDVALVEWLAGPSLGDLVRSGGDHEATQRLGRVALELHAHVGEASYVAAPELQDLRQWFQDLFDLRFDPACSTTNRAALNRAQSLAHELLSDQRGPAPLHGDLHHDNVRASARGDCAFDAKGVWGEPLYELANAFRNPKGAGGLVRSCERVAYLAETWSVMLEWNRQRLLHWASAKTALSIAWRSKGVFRNDAECDLLHTLLHMGGNARCS